MMKTLPTTLNRRLIAAMLIALPSLWMGGCSDDDKPTAPGTPDPPTLEEELSRILDDAIDARTPGVSLRVLGNGMDMTLNAGVASLETNETRTAEHRFHAASVGKAFIGVACARLATDGAFDPAQPISTWLPSQITSRIPQSEQISARMLLQHTSGIVDVLNEIPDAILAIEADLGRDWSNADLVQFALDRPLNFAPGTANSYSNTNYMLLALILEQLTGTTHAQALRDLVFDPLGMNATTTSNHEPMHGPFTHAYIEDGQLADLTEILLRWEFGSGGQWTTVDDLATFLHGIAETDRVLDDSGRALLLTPSAHAPYGFGMAFAETPAGLMLHHHGLLMGSASYMAYMLDNGVSVTMNVNAAAYDEQGVMLADKLFGELMIALNE